MARIEKVNNGTSHPRHRKKDSLEWQSVTCLHWVHAIGRRTLFRISSMIHAIPMFTGRRGNNTTSKIE
jgi:hypothetical protein